MRKLLFLMTLLVSVFAIGCNDKPEPGPQPNDGLSFEFSNIASTATSVEVTITPSNAESYYFADIDASSAIADMDDAAIINRYVTGDNYKLRQGTQVIGKKNLAPSTEYTVIVFGNGEDKVFRQTITTQSANVDPSIFNVELNVSNITARTATVKAIPNNDEVNYFCRIVTKMELSATDGTDLDIMKYCMENPYRNEYFRKGEITFDYVASPKMDYVVVAFNLDTYNDMVAGYEDAVLFKEEFSTPDAPDVDPDTMFLIQNLTPEYNGFTADVTPVRGEDKLWSYYIFSKASFDDARSRNYNQVVREAYYGLQGLVNEYNYAHSAEIEAGTMERITFNDFISDFMGMVGSKQINSYEPLNTGSSYVLVLFYMDPQVVDPTVVYDYDFVAIEFRTLTDSEYAYLDVSEPIIAPSESYGYDIAFIVKTDEKAVDLKVGADLWGNREYDKYWDPNDWTQIEDFFALRKSIGADSLVLAQSADGAVIQFSGVDKSDYVFFFEALTAHGNATQFALRVTPEKFD